MASNANFKLSWLPEFLFQLRKIFVAVKENVCSGRGKLFKLCKGSLLDCIFTFLLGLDISRAGEKDNNMLNSCHLSIKRFQISS